MHRDLTLFFLTIAAVQDDDVAGIVIHSQIWLFTAQMHLPSRPLCFILSQVVLLDVWAGLDLHMYRRTSVDPLECRILTVNF